MTRLAEQLEEAVGALDPEIGFDAVLDRVRERRRARRRRALGTAVVLLVTLGVVAIATIDRSHPASDQIQVQPHVASNTDMLVFDDGYDGVLTVDLATRTVVRRVVEGQAAGDQPFRSLITDHALVVGWNDVWAMPLATGRSHRIGTGVVMPSEVPGRVWLMPFGGAKTYRLVDLQGRTLLEGPGMASNWSPVAIPGGLAFSVPSGIDLWYADSNDGPTPTGSAASQGESAGGHLRLAVLGTSGARPITSSGDELVWCQKCGRDVRISSTTTGATRSVQLPTGTTGIDMVAAAFSPDGRYVAVQTITGNNRARPIVVIDVESARVVRTSSSLPEYGSFTWGDDTHIYLAAAPFDGNPEAGTTIQRIDVTSGASTGMHLPFVAGHNFGVVPRSEADALLDAPPAGPIAACPPPSVQPSGRTHACRFRY
jgi:hypothetical protein